MYTASCQTGCTTQFDSQLNEQLFVKPVERTFNTVVKPAGWMFVYMIQPVRLYRVN